LKSEAAVRGDKQPACIGKVKRKGRHRSPGKGARSGDEVADDWAKWGAGVPGVSGQHPEVLPARRETPRPALDCGGGLSKGRKNGEGGRTIPPRRSGRLCLWSCAALFTSAVEAKQAVVAEKKRYRGGARASGLDRLIASAGRSPGADREAGTAGQLLGSRSVEALFGMLVIRRRASTRSRHSASENRPRLRVRHRSVYRTALQPFVLRRWGRHTPGLSSSAGSIVRAAELVLSTKAGKPPDRSCARQQGAARPGSTTRVLRSETRTFGVSRRALGDGNRDDPVATSRPGLEYGSCRSPPPGEKPKSAPPTGDR